jgi:hypothetical protein
MAGVSAEGCGRCLAEPQRAGEALFGRIKNAGPNNKGYF